MRQLRKGQRAFTRRKPKGTEGNIHRWEDGGEVFIGRMQPFGAIPSGGPVQALAAVYGERIKDMKMLYTVSSLKLLPRDGVCVEVAPDASCDYRVVSVMDWASHQQAVLEWIEEGRRY